MSGQDIPVEQRNLNEHIVPLIFLLEKEGQPSIRQVVTSFVLSVGDRWFLVTAGHCLSLVDDYYIKEGGYTLATCLMADGMSPNAPHKKDPFILSYHQANPFHYFKEGDEYDGIDYGIIPLSAYYRKALEANNIRPLVEEFWRTQPPPTIDFYAMIGVPQQLVNQTTNRISATSSIFRVTKLDKRPNGFREVSFPLFYGHVENVEPDITTLKGMSGGPIFAIHTSDDGSSYVHLVAIQSHANDFDISACYVSQLAHAIEVATKSRPVSS